MRTTLHRMLVAGFVLMLLIPIGCSSQSTRRSPIVSDTLVDALIDKHNERVAHIDRLWARVSVRIKGTDATGDTFEEQGEGHLQVVRPDQVSLTIGKLSETYFAYGSSTDRYWMFDLSDSDRRLALIGAIANLTPARADEIGLSVHPGDLIGALGIESLSRDEIVSSRWVPKEDLVAIARPSRWGITEYWFDPETALVMRVLSLDREGQPIATTALSRYKDLLDDQKLDTGIRVPGKIEIVRAGAAGEFLRIELSEPSQREIKAMVFDPDRLSRAYRIHETIDLDAPEVEAP